MITDSKIKRILIYGETFRGSMPHSVLSALTRLGYDAVIFDYRKYLSNLDGNRYLKKAANITDKIFFEKRCRDINRHFLQQIDNFKPDLILVIKGMHIVSLTLEKIAQIGVPVVNWHADDFFNPVWVTPYTADTFKLYDIHFSSRPHLFPEYKNKGAKQLEYLEFCFDPTICYPIEDNTQEKYDITFIGTWSKIRQRQIKNLARFFKIHIWGGSWHYMKKMPGAKNIRLMYRRADLENFSRVVNNSKICLNFLTPENRDQTNLRNFEIPACQGFQLCNRTDQLAKIFKHDHAIALYQTEQELIDKARYYLEHQNERLEIARQGFGIVTNDNHTFLSRCKQIIFAVESL